MKSLSPRSLLVAATLVATSSAHATDTVWDGSTSVVWGDATNWSATVPDTTTERAVFDGTGTNYAVTFGTTMGTGINGILMKGTQASALTIDASTTGLNFRLTNGAGIMIESGAGAFSMGTSGSAFQLVLNGTTGGQFTPVTFQNDSANLATLGNKITVGSGGNSAWPLTFTGSGDWQVDALLPVSGSGSSTLTKGGTGTLTLTGANAYAGGTTISNGLLVAKTGTALGTGAVSVSGGKLRFDSTGAALTVANQISGGGTVEFTGNSSNRVNLTNATIGGFTGDFHVLSTGVFAAWTTGSAALATTNQNITIDAGGYLALLGASGQTNSFGGLNGDGRITKNTSSSTATLIIGNGDADGSFGGSINPTYLLGSGAIAVTKVGAGTQVFSGASTYSGGTNINGGVLSVTNATGLGTGAVTLDSGTLRSSVTVANTLSVAAGKTGGLDVSAASAVTIGTGAATIDGTLTISRATAGTGSVTLNTAFSGAGTVEIGNTQGGITVSAGSTGRLQASGSAFTNFTGDIHVLGTNGGGNLCFFSGISTTTQKLTIDAGGYMSLNSATGTPVVTTFGGLNGGGSITTNGPGSASLATLSIGNGGADGNFSGVISQSLLTAQFVTLSVAKNGSGTQVFSGANNYGGTTTISGGTLQFAKTASLYAGSSGNWTAAKITAASGATLALNVGGNNEFTSADVNTLLSNLSVANSTTTGLQAGAKIGFDTTNSTGGVFTQGNLIANSTGTSGGAIGVTKLGAGTLVLDKANTYTGATAVTAGTLKVAAATGSIQVGAAGVTVASGAILAVDGKLVLTVTAEGLIANSGTIELNSGSAVLDLNHLFDGATVGQTYNLITGGATTGGFAGFTGYSGGLNTVFDNTTGTLTFTAVPEPSTYGLIGAGVLALAAGVRRRRKLAGKVA